MRRLFFVVLFFGTLVRLVGQTAVRPAEAEIAAFNTKLENATRSMDNAKVLELWAVDGISLLPSTKPMVGKAAIGEFLNTVMGQLQGARMELFEMHCSAIESSGDWASEWCDEHQVVVLAGGKPPFDGRGRMLLVLHKSKDGSWLIEREMWNQS